MSPDSIRTVAVLGAGTMGNGIAHVFARAGFHVILRDVDQTFLLRALDAIGKNLDREVKKGKLPESEKPAVLSRIKPVIDMAAIAAADFAVEAVPEKLEIKRAVLTEADKILRSEVILASNTSSISMTTLAALTSRPSRFVGMHFMNPVPVMELVEVIRTIATDPQVYETAIAFTQKLGKAPVRTSDRPGFIVNRLLVPYLLDAIRALEGGVASVEDIDKSMRLGCGHPMGPFVLLDFIGLDTTYYIANILFDEFKESRFAPPGLLKRLV